MVLKNENADLAELLRELGARVPVDAAELLAKQPPERIDAVLHALPKETAVRIALALPDALRPRDTAAVEIKVPGLVSELMEPARGVLPAHTTVAGAVDFLRRCEDVAQITYFYVTNAEGRLVGLIVMRDLLLAGQNQTLDQVMLHDPFILGADMSIGSAVQAALRRHYPVYPVCDQAGRIVGLVRGWKLFERQAIEISAQSGSMVGVDKEERLATTVMPAFRMRHPWLQVNLLTAFLSSVVVAFFSSTIQQIVVLAAFLPLLAGQSGNTGCQALAITLRGMTLGEMKNFPTRRLFSKEMRLGLLNGLLTGLVAATAMWWYASPAPEAMRLALVILLAMTGGCVVAGTTGVMIPLLLRRFGADPVTASSIFLTTCTDIAGMGLMLFLATVIVL